MGVVTQFQPTVNVASRCAVPSAIIASGKQWFSRSSHLIWDDCVSLQLVFSNFYGTGGVESTTSLNTITFTASIEWPLNTAVNAGVLTQAKFSGASSGTCAVGANLVSDPIVPALAIPRGSRIRVRVWGSTAGGLPICGGLNSARSISGGSVDDIYRWSTTTVTDQTMALSISAMSYPLDVRGYKPVAVIAPSGRRSYALIGDSRAQGWLNSSGPDMPLDTQSLIGEGERVVGQLGPFINMAFASDAAANFTVAQSPLRIALLPYVTAIHCQYGINDIFGGAASTINARMRAIKETIAPGKRLTINTCSPSTTGTFLAADGSDQTVTAQEAVRVAWNEMLRSGESVADEVIEIADICESSRNSGKWKAGARAITDAVTASGSATVTSATASFTSSDVNKSLWVPGAGINSGDLCALILLINSASSVTLSSPAWHTGSGQTAQIGDVYTMDGLHASQQGNVAIQAKVPLPFVV